MFQEVILSSILETLSITAYEVVKDDETHMVLETPTRFVKICLIDEDDCSSRFRTMINDAYAQEYREIGIDWEHFVVDVRGRSFSVERREKLMALEEVEMPVVDAAKALSKITRRVERRLGFANILIRVRGDGPSNIRKVALINSHELDSRDYAVDTSGNVVNLKTSTWFLALIGIEGKVMENVPSAFIPVICGNHDFVFMPQMQRGGLNELRVFAVAQKWWLSDVDVLTVRNFLNIAVADKTSYYSHNLSLMLHAADSSDEFWNLLREFNERNDEHVDGEEIDVGLLKENLSVDDAVNSICLVENKKDIATNVSQVIWNKYKYQVVIESDDYFYKIYEEELPGPGKFYSQIRKCLCKAYNKLGIYWKVVTFERDNSLFDFEQREKLRVASDKDCSFDDILISFSSVLNDVEEFMEFKEIASQLKESEPLVFRELKELKLGRFCSNKFEDFAYFGRKAILLDDADFYITLINYDGEQFDVPSDVEVPVKTSYGDFLFTKRMESVNDEFSETRTVPYFDVAIHGWYLYSAKSKEATAEINVKKNHTSAGKSKSIVKSGNSRLLSKDSKSKLDTVELIAGMRDESCDTFFPFQIENEDEEIIEVNCQSDGLCPLFEFLDKFERVCEKSQAEDRPLTHQLVVHTCFDGALQTFEVGQFRTWSNVMTAINSYYPHVRKLTSIMLTCEFCELYLEGNFPIDTFCHRFKTSVDFCVPVELGSFPKRRLFREFALRLVKCEPQFLQCFFIKEDKKCTKKTYCDSDASMIADFNQIVQSWQVSQIENGDGPSI